MADKNYINNGKKRIFAVEHKKKLSESHKGKHSSQKTEFKKGNPHPKHRDNCKCFRCDGCGNPKSHVAWNKGTKGISKGGFKKGHILFNKKHSIEAKIKIGKFHRGKIVTDITKNKIRKARQKQILPTKDTSIEVKIQNFLKQLGIEYFTHQYMKIEHGYQCDILIPSMNLVIECDGDYWHKYPIGNDLDHIRTSELISKGFKVLRLWEHEIKAMELNEFKGKLKNDN